MQLKILFIISIGDYDEYTESSSGTCKSNFFDMLNYLIECHNAVYGCLRCEEKTTSQGTFVYCYDCQDGLFMLNNYTLSANYPTYHSFCVEDCHQAHSDYINDYHLNYCQLCGEWCPSCNLKYGCEYCQGQQQQKGWGQITDSSQYYTMASTFKFCKECSQSGICYACDSTGSCSYCYSCCTWPGNQLSSYGYYYQCLYLDYNTYYSYLSGYDANCLSYNYWDGYDCLICSDNYYICTDCNYNSNTGVWYDGCYQYCSASSYYPEHIRCDLAYDASWNIVNNGWTGCRYGYVDATTGLCTSNCGTGYYGLATFNSRAMIDSSQCYSCDSSCYECIDQYKCVSCQQGYYLYTGSHTASYGTCYQKSGTLSSATLYITNYSGWNYANSDGIDGSYSNPFNSLQDAITKAYELGAPYTSATVYIYFKSTSVNAMYKFNPSDLYMPIYRDDWSQTTQIIIDSYTGSQVTVNYKLKGGYIFKVGGGLTIRNVKFNAIDSMLNVWVDWLWYYTGCTWTATKYCCTFDLDTQGIGGDTSCFFIKTPTEECPTPTGSTFIEFDMSAQTMLTSPPQLTLYNVEFTNYFYEIDSFIKLNDYGGKVSISSSKFTYFSTCGAIIRNKVAPFKRTDIGTSTLPDLYANRANNYQYDLYYDKKNKLTNPYTCSSSSLCFDLQIDSTTFTGMGVLKKNMTEANWVDPTYKMQHQGSIIDLDAFAGNIAVRGSTFTYNTVHYSSCDISYNMDLNINAFTDNYSNLGTKSVIQIKSLISVINHNYQFDLLGNVFTGNTGTKGIIFLDMKDRASTNRVLIAHNKFTQNGGYLDNNVIYLRARGPSASSIYTTTPSNGNLFCTGYHFQANTFTNNFGCTNYGGGVIKFECVEDSDTYSQANDRYTHSTLSSTMQTNYANIDFTAYTTNTQSYTWNGNTYTIDFNQNTFSYNVYTENFATYASGLVDLKGVPRVQFLHETYTGNGDMNKEALNKFSTPTQYINAGAYEMSISDALYNYPSYYTNSLKARSMIQVVRVAQIKMYNMTFSSNWLLETSYDTYRAQLASFSQFYGQFDLDKLYVTSQKGMNNAYFTTNLGGSVSSLSTLQQSASMFPLIRWQSTDSVTVSNLLTTGSTFSDVQFYQDSSNTDSNMFFTVTASGTTYYATTLTIASAYFYNVNCYQCTRSPFILQANTLLIYSSTFSYINSAAYTASYPCYKPLFDLTIYKTYTQTTTVTDTITFNYVTASNIYGNTDGRFIDIAWASITGEQTPTVSQVFVQNSVFSNLYNDQNGGFAQLDVDTIQMTMSNVTFSNIYSGYSSSAASYGGVLYIKSLASLTMTSITASNFYAQQTTTTNGGGRFIYISQNAAFTLSLSSSTFNCSTTAFTPATIQSQLTSSTYTQGSCFHLDTQTLGLTVTIDASTVQNCYTSYQGAAVYLITSSTTKALTLTSTKMSGNAAINGGSVQCSGCTMTLQKNTFDGNRAYNGGDLYIATPISSVTLDSHTHSSSLAYNYGGSIYYFDSTSTSTIFTMNLATGTTSSFSTISSTLDGGLVYFSVTNALTIATVSTTFSNIAATTSGGLFYIDSTMISSVDLTMTSSTVSTISASGGSGSILYVPSTSTSSSVTATSTTFTTCTSTGNGGLFYLDGTTTKSISMVGSTLTSSSSSTGNGGIAYMSGTTNSFSTDSSSTVATSTAATNGGVVYMAGTGAHTLSLAGTISTVTASSGSGGLAYLSASGTSLTSTISATITTATASVSGGLVYSSVTGDNTLTISGATITSVSATGGSGGAFYLDGTTKTITITSSTFTTITSSDKGGIFYTGSSTSTIGMTISSSTFNGFQAITDGSFISLQGTTPALTLSISNSVFGCLSTSMWASWPTTYNTIVSNLNTLTTTIGGAFYFGIGTTGTVTSSSNTFKQCYTTTAGAIFYLQSGMVLTDTSSTFKQNAGLYGQIYCDACTATFTSTIFQDSLAYSGSVLYMDNGATVAFDTVTMSYGKALMYGGAIYAGGTGTASITFTNCASIIQYYQSYQDGGFMYINNPSLTVSSSSCSWQHLYASSNGGYVYGPSISGLSVSSCSMTNITSGSSGSMIASSTSGMTLSVSNCVFQCLSSYSSSTMSSNINAGTSTIGSLFDISNAASVTSSSNTFKYCYTAASGSVFKLTSTSFTDTGSTFSYNSALNGGALSLSSVTSTFTSTVFTNHNAQYGGVMYVDGASSVSFDGITVSTSTSLYDGGFIYAYDSAGTNTITITFTGTTTMSTLTSTSGNGGTFYLDGALIAFSIGGTSTITSSYAYLKGGLAYIANANTVAITSSTQTSTYSLGSGSFIYSTASSATFTISSSNFKCKSSAFTTNEPSLTNQVSGIGGAFYIKDATSITTSSNTIENCYIGDVGGAYYVENTQMTDSSSTYKYTAALKGGAFYCKTCTLSITSSTFYYHQAFEGGVFYLEEQVSVTLDNIGISNCYTAKNGGVVYATESTSPTTSSLTFQNTASIATVTSVNSGGSFYIDHSSLNIYMNTAITLTSSYVTTGKGGVFYYNRGKDLQISGSTFTGYSSSSSGSFLYSVATNLALTASTNTFDCMGTTWSSLSSSLSTPTYTYGGSFYISGATTTVSSTSNTFQNCYTGDYGGGFSLISSSLSDTSSTFKYNGAQYGGAIYCDSCTLTLTSSIFTYNQAYNGGTFYIKSHSGTLTATSITVSNTYSYNQGGMMYITGTSTNTISLDSFTVSSTSSLKEGGMIYASNSLQSLTLTSMILTTSTAGTKGGVFYFDNVATVTISSGTFSTFSAASQGSFMHSIASTMILSLSTNDIKCLSSAYVYSTNLQSKMTAASPTYDIGGAFYIKSAISVTSSTNTIHYCWLCDQGSAYSLYSTTFTDSGSTYTSNAGLTGGLFYIDTSTVTISSATVSNTYANSGGVFYVIDVSPLTVSSSTFTSSTAVKYGGISYHADPLTPSGSYSASFSTSTFATTASGTKGGAFYFDSSLLTAITIDSSTFTTTTSGTYGGVFYVNSIGGGMTIKSSSTTSYFSVFSASTQGSFLYSADSNFFLKIYNSYIQCQTSYSSTSATTALSGSTYSMAGAIYISGSTSGVTSSSNIYRYCYATNTGGIYTLISTSMTDSSSEYNYNQALNGGAIKCDTCTMTITDSVFYQNKAQDGGAILMDNEVAMTATSTDFQGNSATDSGGAVSIIKSSLSTLSSTSVSFISCNTIQSNTADYGGFINIDNEYVSLSITSSSVYSISATVQGGVIEALSAATISLTSSQFTNFYAPDSSFLYSSSNTMILSISSSTFDCNNTMQTKDVSNLLNKQIPLYTITTTFSITDALNITSQKSTYTHCGTSQFGGVFDISNSPFYDTSSSFSLNSAAQGGVISCQTCTMYLKSSTFSENYANKGGVVNMGQSAYMKGTVVKFSTNKAYASAGVLYVSTQSYFELAASEFSQNSANLTSTIEILGSSDTHNNTIKGCTFQSNTAIKNTLSFMYAQIVVISSEFNYNTATSRTKNIFIGFSTMVMTGCLFKSTVYGNAAANVLAENTFGTYFFIIFDVNLYVYKTKFYDGLASEGGAIYISGDCNVNFYSCQFKNNYARTNGGAIYAAGFNNLYVGGSGTEFQNNFAHESGDDFFVLNTEKNFTIENAVMSNPKAKQSIRADTVSLVVNNVDLSGFQGTGSEAGAAIYCSNCRSINVKLSSFRNMKSILGGAIYLTETSVNKKSTDKKGKYTITDSEFDNIQAITGGAIYADNPQYLTIKNTQFNKNLVYYSDSVSDSQIAGSGGSLYFTCDSTTQNCAVDISGCKFQNGYAQIQGGAIYWDTIEPKISNIYFNNNSAGQYGDNIASFAQKLGIITQEQYIANLKKLGKYNDDSRRMLSGVSYLSNTTVTDQQSGGTIPDTYLAHIDQYNQIVGSDFSSKVRVSVDATSNLDPRANVYPPIIEGNSQFTAIGGVVKVTGISFAATPGYTYSISFSTDGIDTTKKSNKDYLTSIGTISIDFSMKIQLRECDVGEQFTTSGKCIECPEGTSFSLVKMSQPGSCQSCPSEKATCYGGTNVGPKPGYWRKSNNTSNFIECLVYSACLGMIPPQNDPMGTCATGYQGILCTDCQKGYSRTGDYECSQCPDQTSNIVRLAFIFLIVIFGLVFMIRSTLMGALNKTNVTSIYLKIVLNHVQLILLTASFNFDWPKKVVEFFDTAKPVASASTQILSVDCFIDMRSSNSTTTTTPSSGGIRIFFQKLVMLAFLPFLLAGCSYGFWYTYKWIKKNKIDVRGKAISTLVIVLFLVHPNIVQYMFNDFKCLDVDGEERVYNDLQVVCWNQEHKIFSYFVALPSIVVWGLGIPFFAFILLSRIRKNLDSLESREKLGFLYRGYRKQFYYWEIIIMYRKILLIFIAVFLNSVGVIAQALIVFLILIGFSFINTKKKPFSTVALNDLEMLSLATSMITVYCGLFFISNMPSSWRESNPDLASSTLTLNDETMLFFFAIIVICNLIFFIYWGMKMFSEIRSKFRKALPRVYMWLCLCGDKYKLEKEFMVQNIKEENELLKEEFYKRLKGIKELYKKGEIVLTNNSLERMMVYLQDERLKEISGMIERPDSNQVQRNQKRFNRIRQGEEHTIAAISGKIHPSDKFTPDKFDQITDDGKKQHTKMNGKYQDYEDLAVFGAAQGGQMNIMHPKDFLPIDEGFFEESSMEAKGHHLRAGSGNFLIQVTKLSGKNGVKIRPNTGSRVVIGDALTSVNEPNNKQSDINPQRIGTFYDDSLDLETLSVENVKENESISFTDADKQDANTNDEHIPTDPSPKKFAKLANKKVEDRNKMTRMIEDDDFQIKFKSKSKKKGKANNQAQDSELRKKITRTVTKKENKDILKQITLKSHLSIDLPDSDKDSFEDDDDEGQKTNDRLFDKSIKMKDKFNQLKDKIEKNMNNDDDLTLDQIEEITERLVTEENKQEEIINVGVSGQQKNQGQSLTHKSFDVVSSYKKQNSNPKSLQQQAKINPKALKISTSRQDMSMDLKSIPEVGSEHSSPGMKKKKSDNNKNYLTKTASKDYDKSDKSPLKKIQATPTEENEMLIDSMSDKE